jgi:hypothetical protein
MPCASEREIDRRCIDTTASRRASRDGGAGAQRHARIYDVSTVLDPISGDETKKVTLPGLGASTTGSVLVQF